MRTIIRNVKALNEKMGLNVKETEITTTETAVRYSVAGESLQVNGCWFFESNLNNNDEEPRVKPSKVLKYL